MLQSGFNMWHNERSVIMRKNGPYNKSLGPKRKMAIQNCTANTKKLFKFYPSDIFRPILTSRSYSFVE